jgi:hypothetical protein
LSISYSAISCDEYNLYKTNKSFASIPISDQDSVGTCYAHVATTLLDTERFENGVDMSKRTHPLFSAYAYKKDESSLFSSQDDLAGGDTAKAIKALANRKLCYESDGEKLISKYKGSKSLSDEEFMNIIEETYEYFISKDPSENKSAVVENKRFLGCSDEALNSTQIVLNNVLKNLRIVPEKIIPYYVMENIFKGCIESSRPTPLVTLSKLKTFECNNCTDSSIVSYLIKQLKRNKPVGIGYCSKVLNDKNANMLEDNNLLSPFDNSRIQRTKEGCGLHESVVSGSRKVGGQCQLLVRNTWGDWKSKVWNDCLCETSKGVYESCKPSDGKINSVGCWIDSKALSRNVVDMVHF